jgi:hypothetical protein
MVNCGVLFEVRTDFLKYYLDELRIQMVNSTDLHPRKLQESKYAVESLVCFEVA